MSRSLREIAEAARDRARLHYLNAGWHAREVAHRFGVMSPEYAVAVKLLDHEQRALVATYDDLIALDRRAALR